ncbi:MAG: RsmB/NOP family class I SAM-dependent RNA methyltransferase [Betaproteobacteria bacterium]|nr:RsmB/NOP family class I SAM-dependent RNA methyltransferase [Betaproteobacteria bacterium]
MRITRMQLEAATEALELVLKFDRPADAVLHDYFRAHRALGSHDRAFVADSVYGVLRYKRTLESLSASTGARRLLIIYLLKINSLSIRELSGVLSAAERSWAAGVKAASLDGAPLAVRAELPDWIVERLARAMPEAEILALARGLNQPAPLDLRVNSLRASREEALRGLASSGIEAEPTPYSPVGLRVRGRPAINRHPLFEAGALEVQDEGSQLLCHLVAPRRHDLVADFCAGAGGKSLMLGALMHSRGRLYAFDVSSARLARLKPRLKRSGLSNLYAHPIRNENDPRVKRLAGKMDRVLVDAPCSGLGTLRRNPDLKWRQSPRSVEELKAKQAAILRAAANLVKPGGRLVYATCSLLAEENEDIVSAFLAERPEFQQLDCARLLRESRIALDTGPFLRLCPHLHGTDGFFAAALARG